ncbi:hypothetical protein VNI00_013088, partial [Paramarasmius palmivorus]
KTATERGTTIKAYFQHSDHATVVMLNKEINSTYELSLKPFLFVLTRQHAQSNTQSVPKPTHNDPRPVLSRWAEWEPVLRR